MPPEAVEQRAQHTLDLFHALEDSDFSFTHESNRIFEIEGHRYDLGAADPEQIQRIVDEGLMRL